MTDEPNDLPLPYAEPVGECGQCGARLYPGDDYAGFCVVCATVQEYGGEG